MIVTGSEFESTFVRGYYLHAGRKSGKGIFTYDDGGKSKTKPENPAAIELLKSYSIPAKLE